MVHSAISKDAKKVVQLVPNKLLRAVNSRGQGFSLNILFSSEFIIFNGLYPSMGLLPLSGPGGQTGRSANGQYVYWICMAHPTQETLAAKPGMKTPADFSRALNAHAPHVHGSFGARKLRASAPHSEQLPVKCCKYCIIYNTSYTLL